MTARQGTRRRYKEGCTRNADCFQCMAAMEYGLDTPECILALQEEYKAMADFASVTLTTKGQHNDPGP